MDIPDSILIVGLGASGIAAARFLDQRRDGTPPGGAKLHQSKQSANFFSTDDIFFN